MADKEQVAIERLKQAAEMSEMLYHTPLSITVSGGKDSSVILELARRSGIPFEVMHNHTTADAPETVRFVRSEFKRMEELGIKCYLNFPKYKGERASMWKLIPKKLIPPTRLTRYCCDVLKEGFGKGRYIATGVRWAESVKRRNNRSAHEVQARKKENTVLMLNVDNDENRRLFETCQLKGRRICNPIIDWSDDDVWEYISGNKIPLNPLYQEGFSRVGCIGCPLAGKKRYAEFARYPKYKQMYISAFDRMVEERKKRGRTDFATSNWKSGIDTFHWWMEDGVIPGQISLLED